MKEAVVVDGLSYKSENDVKKQIKKLLDAHGWWWWMPGASAFGSPNVDFNMLRDSVFIAIEAKFGKNKPTPLQLRFLVNSRAQKSYGFVVDEHRVSVLKTWLEAFDSAIDATRRGEAVAKEDTAALLLAQDAMMREMHEEVDAFNAKHQHDTPSTESSDDD